MKIIKQTILLWSLLLPHAYAGVTWPQGIGITTDIIALADHSPKEIGTFYEVIPYRAPISLDFYGDINIKKAKTPLTILIQELIQPLNYRLSYQVEYMNLQGFYTKYESYDTQTTVLNQFLSLTLDYNLFSMNGYFLDAGISYNHLLYSKADSPDGLNGSSILYEHVQESPMTYEVGIGKTLKNLTVRIAYTFPQHMHESTLSIYRNGSKATDDYTFLSTFGQLNTSLIFWW